MLLALDWPKLHAAEFGGASVSVCFLGSGGLSSVLDNAPTHLSFLSTMLGTVEGETEKVQMAQLLSNPEMVARLVALGLGAVFSGANTDIGNGPNFMVKAIAEQHRIRTPGFVGYVVKFTVPIRVPVWVVIWWFFVR
jgi:Na+/H+ antiporter NhaD/arsenite permease-like protein